MNFSRSTNVKEKFRSEIKLKFRGYTHVISQKKRDFPYYFCFNSRNVKIPIEIYIASVKIPRNFHASSLEILIRTKCKIKKLTLTAAASYDVLQERVLGGYQAPAPPWHPLSLEWSRILVAAVAVRTSASLRLGRSRAGRNTLRRSCACIARVLHRTHLQVSHGISRDKKNGTPRALGVVRDVATH